MFQNRTVVLFRFALRRKAERCRVPRQRISETFCGGPYTLNPVTLNLCFKLIHFSLTTALRRPNYDIYSESEMSKT